MNERKVNKKQQLEFLARLVNRRKANEVKWAAQLERETRPQLQLSSARPSFVETRPPPGSSFLRLTRIMAAHRVFAIAICWRQHFASNENATLAKLVVLGPTDRSFFGLL